MIIDKNSLESLQSEKDTFFRKDVEPLVDALEASGMDRNAAIIIGFITSNLVDQRVQLLRNELHDYVQPKLITDYNGPTVHDYKQTPETHRKNMNDIVLAAYNKHLNEQNIT